MNRGFVVGLSVLWSVLVGAQGAVPASDPIIGVWTANVAKSSYSPGPPPPSTFSSLRQYSTLPDGWMRFVQTSSNQNGEPTVQVGIFKMDGKQYPVHNVATVTALMTSGKATNTTRSYRRIDPNTVESTTYTDNVAGIPVVRSVSKDGKTFTETTKGKDSQGRAVNNVVIYERVR